MILGDSLLVMASLSAREDLQGKVQCIYFDPPYGIKFNSNFQWSTTRKPKPPTKRMNMRRKKTYGSNGEADFISIILENLRSAGPRFSLAASSEP